MRCEITAVIKTDFQLLKSYLLTTYLLWIPLAAMVNVLQGGLFFSVCTVSAVGLFGSVMQLGTADEVSGNFQLLRLTFPQKRTVIQVGHFLSIFLATLVGYLVGLFAALISWIILLVEGKDSIPFGFWGEIVFSFGIFAIALFIGALMLVCLAQFGFTKGFRYFPWMVALLSLLIVPLFMPSGPFGALPSQVFVSIMNNEGARLITSFAALAGSCALYVVSAFLAGALYKKRQF